MSCPFSYNDENFTVIGNILFVHFNDNKARKAHEPLVQIPYEIFKRMCSYSSNAIVSSPVIKSAVFTVSIEVVMDDNKPYFAFTSDKSAVDIPRFHYCIYLLKDI